MRSFELSIRHLVGLLFKLYLRTRSARKRIYGRSFLFSIPGSKVNSKNGGE
jgi:hypothetical protein